MGSYLELHVGPYMLVSKLPIKKDVVKQVCVNSDCTQFELESKAPFCPQCGDKTRHKTFTKDDYKDVRDIMYRDDFEDQMVAVHNGGTDFSKMYHVLIPNHSMSQLDPCGIDMDDEKMAEIKPDRMAREITWFMNEYPALIAEIIREFGEEAVQVKWGIIKHYN